MVGPVDLARLSEALRCPDCRGALASVRGRKRLRCGGCGKVFGFGPHGYLEFGPFAGAGEADARLEGYADRQLAEGDRLYFDYLEPLARAGHVERLLDAGCGAGRTASLFNSHGFEAFGVDLPKVALFWERAGNDPSRFLSADVTRLPFPDSYFDLVLSLGVIEHVGTVVGHRTLRADYRELRRRYADELLRVTRRGGRIVVSCPNKGFPLDLHHGPSDEAGSTGPVGLLVHRATGLNLHLPWGRSHLVSYREVRELFCGRGRAAGLVSLPLRGYFSFGGIGSGAWRSAAPAARWYLEHLPPRLRGSWLNPFLLAQIRR